MLQVPSLWSPRPLTAVEPEFREDQTYRAESSGTRCQVSRVMWHAALWKCSGPSVFSKRRKQFVPVASRNLRFALLVFLVVSGTVVAPIESCELSRFEIP